jgi:DNA (cytosine-5)-methyltransferase 1
MGIATSGRCARVGEKSAYVQSLQTDKNFWSDAEWLLCRDGKQRPAQPGIFPLAHGVPARVGRLRAAGNAIVPPLAAEFIKAVMNCIPLDSLPEHPVSLT